MYNNSEVKSVSSISKVTDEKQKTEDNESKITPRLCAGTMVILEGISIERDERFKRAENSSQLMRRNSILAWSSERRFENIQL